MAFPTVRSFDPAFHYETAVIIFDGLKRLYEDGETAIYYIMVGNENYVMPAMPEGCEEGIIKGMYKFRSNDVASAKQRVQLFGSGAIMNCVLKAQEMLAEKYQIASDVWSVTSYTQLRRDAQECRRWNMFHPTSQPRTSYLEDTLAGINGPFIAASDYVQAHSEQIADFLPGDMVVLGTDGMGRSETRPALRRHFEVDAECIVIAALYKLHQDGHYDAAFVENAIKELGVDPEKVYPLYA
jgi:pyruvate dehydrogenase E1 component